MINFPQRKYSVILADPPWQYRDKASAGNRGAEFKYPCMTLKDICALPVPDIAADDCYLFLWVTAPLLPDGLKVIEAWNFTYKTFAFTWVKRNKKSGSYFWGMGNYTRQNSELCLLATKGKLPRVSAAVHSVIDAPIARHSQKPMETYERIVQLLGDIPRIELFARQRIDGWDAWGNEVS